MVFFISALIFLCAVLHFLSQYRPLLSELLLISQTINELNFMLQPKLTMARCRRNVDNFLEACRRIGVEEVSINYFFLVQICFLSFFSNLIDGVESGLSSITSENRELMFFFI